jgi:hypothetical protein
MLEEIKEKTKILGSGMINDSYSTRMINDKVKERNILAIIISRKFNK